MNHKINFTLDKNELQASGPVSGEPLHIGFFTDTYAPQINGIAVSLQLLTNGLRAAGHYVTVFAPRLPGHRDSDGDVYRIPAVRYMQLPSVYIAIPGTPRTTLALRRSQFDILHVHSPLTIGMLAYITAQLKNLPLIYTYHTSITDYTHYLKIGGQTRPVLWATRWFSKTTTNLSDQVIVPSAKFKRVLQEQNVKRPIHLIPNGIDLANFHNPKSPGAYRQRLGLNPNQPLLLYVGRLAPEKKLELVIDAFAHAASQNMDAHLVIAGDGNGSSRSQLEERAAASGYGRRIHFLGMIDRSDLPNLLGDGTLFLSASTTETQCIAMLEAIAAGLPVVAVWDDAFEGMLVDGQNGRITPPDARPFGALICNMLADHAARKAFGQRSLELSRKFSVETQADTLVDLYRQAIVSNTGNTNQYLMSESFSNINEKHNS